MAEWVDSVNEFLLWGALHIYVALAWIILGLGVWGWLSAAWSRAKARRERRKLAQDGLEGSPSGWQWYAGTGEWRPVESQEYADYLHGSFSYQHGPIPPGTMTSRELADTEDD